MHGGMKGQTQKKGKDNGESLWKMALLGMTKLGVRSCVYTRDIYKSVRRRGRAASWPARRGCFQILLPNAETTKERPSALIPVFSLLLFFSKTSELVSTVKCFFPLSLVRVSLLPFRHRCEEIRTEKKQHTGRRI